MIPVAVGELEGVTLVGGDAETIVRQVVADSRLVLPGALFVCLPGSRADGHDFVEDALGRGAVAVLCESGRGRPRPGAAVLEAADPLAALGLLASRVRRRSHATVVGVAGTAGKTTTKDVLCALLGPVLPTVSSPASFNNSLGVPLTLALLEPDTRACVCELGTTAPGQLAAVCRIAEPDLGVVTAVGPEHLETLDSVEGAVAAEAELIDALGPGSPLVLPFDEPLLDAYRRSDLDEWTFGVDSRADVHPLRWAPGPFSTEAAFDVRGETVSLTTNLTLPYQRRSLAAAVAVFAALGLPLEALADGAASVALSPWRGEERRLDGSLLINDAYNANPVSMRAAFEALVDRADGRRRVAILGEMAELGATADAWHVAVGAEAVRVGVDLLVAVGPLADRYLVGAEGRVATCWIPDVSAAGAALAGLLQPGDAVLLKGSRVTGLERLAPAALAALSTVTRQVASAA